MSDEIRYLEGLTVTQGRLSGEKLTVFPWQKRFIRGAFAPDVGTAGLSVARGAGKTTLVAGIACAALDGPLAVPRGETIIVASSFDQARIAFDHVLAFLGERVDLKDRSRWRVWDTAQQARILNRATGASVKCLASDPRRAHGLAPVLTLLDEPAQWPENVSERMVAALRTAAGKQPQSRMIALGTRPASETHWFQRWLDGLADYTQSHTARAVDPPFQRRTWKKANPSLDYMPDLERAIRSEAADAKKDPSVMASFRALRLNQGTADTTQSTLLDVATWARIEGDAPRQGQCVWGLDLGTSAAQSAVAAYWPDSGRLEVLAAFPGEPSLGERGLADGVGALYQRCAERGELIQVGGAAVSIAELLESALGRFGKPKVIAADRWREAELRDSMKLVGLRAPLELRGQGFKDGGEDVRLFQRSCLDDRVHPLPSLLLSYAVSEARTLSDPAGNEKLAKGSEGGRRQRARDDACAAAILAVSLGQRRRKRSSGVYLGAA